MLAHYCILLLGVCWRASAYDAILRIFGGSQQDLSQNTYFNDMDTLQLSYASSTWSCASNWTYFPATAASPVTRRSFGYHLVDSASDETVMLMGLDDTVYLNDAYRLTNGNWQVISATGTLPNASMGFSSVLLSANSSILVFGGKNAESVTSYNNRLYSFNYVTNVWTDLTPLAPNPPSARGLHAAVYMEATQKMLVFGGTNLFSTFKDLWELDLSVAPYQWRQLSPVGTPPAARTMHTMVYEPAQNSVYLWGGLGVGTDPAATPDWNIDIYQYNVLGSAWAVINTTNTLIPNVTAPFGRRAHTAVFHTETHSMFIFGGQWCRITACTHFNDLWVFSIGDLRWTQLLAANAPQPRFGNGMSLLVLPYVGTLAPVAPLPILTFVPTAAPTLTPTTSAPTNATYAPTVPPTQAPTQAPTHSPTAGVLVDDSAGEVDWILIIEIVLGGLLGLVLCVLFICYCLHLRKKRKLRAQEAWELEAAQEAYDAQQKERNLAIPDQYERSISSFQGIYNLDTTTAPRYKSRPPGSPSNMSRTEYDRSPEYSMTRSSNYEHSVSRSYNGGGGADWEEKDRMRLFGPSQQAQLRFDAPEEPVVFVPVAQLSPQHYHDADPLVFVPVDHDSPAGTSDFMNANRLRA